MDRREWFRLSVVAAGVALVVRNPSGIRMSVHRDDPGWHPDAFKYRAYCNGVEIPHCFTADERLGIAWGYGPTPTIDPNNRDRIIVHETRGKIELRQVDP